MVLSDIPYYLIPAFALLMAGMAGWFAWRQMQQLFWLRTQRDLSTDERSYFRWQSIRRFSGCALMVCVAVMLAGLMGMRILERLDELIIRSNQAQIDAQPLTPLSDEEKSFVLFSFAYVGVLMGAVMLLIGLGLWELRAIRLHGIRQRRRIREDERSMLERQLPALYRERRQEPGNWDEDDDRPQ